MMALIKLYIKRIYLKYIWKRKCRFCGTAIADRKSTFHGKNYLGNNTNVINAHFGYASGVGIDCFLKDIEIGKYCCLAGDIRTVVGIHPTNEVASIHPAFYSTTQQWGFTYIKEPCFEVNHRIDKNRSISFRIGNDVWVGEGVRLLEGVKIGDGAIVAAGAVVVKDVEPYSIVGGVPAKHIKYRFDEETRRKLLELRWWDKDERWIREHAELFRNVEALLNAQD